MRRQALILALTIVFSRVTASYGIEVSLVADLEQGPPAPWDYIPQTFVAAGTRALFQGFTEKRGSLVWVTDGSASGTGVLTDLGTGGSSPVGSVGSLALIEGFHTVWSTGGSASNTRRLLSQVELVGELTGPGNLPAYLLTLDPAVAPGGKTTLWRTDGTTSGTRALGTFEHLTDSKRWLLVKLGERLLLHAAQDELWVWDSRSGGIRLLSDRADFRAGLIPYRGGVAFFRPGGTGSFPELWRSDGTPEGTKPIKRLDGTVLEFATLGNRLYFIHSDDTHGQELWESDGSERGTRRLSAFPYARAFIEQPVEKTQPLLRRVGNQLLFEISGGHDSQIWWLLKPGQKAPRRLLGCAGGCPSVVNTLGTSGPRVVFVGRVGAGASALYASDGTPAGTRPLRANLDASHLGFWQTAADKLFFLAGPSLWVTDGTDSGTQQLLPAAGGFYIVGRVGSRWWIGVLNGLWSTDGTPAGTKLVKAPLLRANESSSAFPLAALGSSLLFCDGHGKLFAKRTGGAAEPLPPEAPTCQQVSVASDIGVALFQGIEEEGSSYWRSDGTLAGTTRLQPPAGFADSTVLSLAQWDGTLLAAFGGNRLAGVFRLTKTGWDPLFQTNYGFLDFVPPQASPPDLLFCDNGGVWKADLVGAVQNLAPLPACPSIWAAHLGESAIFYRYSSVGVEGILRCTATGSCSALPQLAPAPPFGWLVSHGRLFLLASGAADKARALWRVEADGTVARLAPLCEGQAISTLPHSVFMELGSKVIFGCGNTGELWVSDGTPAGTTRLRESPGEDPGRRLDSGTALSKLGNLVLFPGYDIEHGWELWGTDGTKAGTQLVRDIVPGPESSNPAGFLAGNGAVYFSAWDPEHGRELWAATP